VGARGGEVLTGHTAEALEERSAGIVVRTRSEERVHEHAICAVSPHRTAALIAGIPALASVVQQLERLRYQPIYSVYLQFTRAVRLPAIMLGLGGVAQWVFDRESLSGQTGLLGAVISAEGPHQHMPQDALAETVRRELEDELGPLPPLAWHRVIAEKRATFECSVGLVRPSTRTPLADLHLAGDYTESDYPATLEAAVRSGIAAAKQVLECRGKPLPRSL
jgi:uncharacterized protein with NAD-binding domain and iron-sulfur cluster